MKTFDLNENPQNIVDYLTYCSYAHNRKISPNTTPEQWGVIFQNWEALEKRYQQELTEINQVKNN